MILNRNSTGRLLIVFLFVTVTAARGREPSVGTPNRPPSEDQVWKLMTPQLSTEVIEVLQELESLRGDIQMLKEDLEEGRDDLKDLEDTLTGARDPLAAVTRIVEVFSRRSESLRSLIGYNADLKAHLDSAESRARALRLDAELALDLAEEDLRSMAESVFRTEEVVEVLEVYETRILPALEVLRDPARSARALVDGKIKEWLSRPVDIDGLRFRIKELSDTQSLFDPESGITIVVEYLGGDLPKVEAAGLYFRRDGTPVFDGMKFTTDVNALLDRANLTRLGDAIGDLGLPIKFKNIKALGFNPDDRGRRGGIQFDLEIALALDSLPLPKFTQDEISIYTDGSVDLKGETTLTCMGPDTPFPIGTTPLAFHGYTLELTPKPPRMGIGSTISAAAPGSGKAIGLDVKSRFGFPIRKIEFEGALVAASGVVLGSVTGGEISPEKIRGHLSMPGNDGKGAADGLLAKIMTIEGDFEFNAEGLFVQGKVSLFSGPHMDLDARILTNGHGTVTGRGEFKIGGIAHFEADVQGSFKPGMKDLLIKSVALARLDLALFEVDAALDITADGEKAKEHKLPIFVKASVMGLDVSFDLPTFLPWDMLIIYEELRKAVPDFYKRSLEALADFEADSRELLANEEKKFRESVASKAKKHGIDALRTKNAAVNAALGDISEGGKKAIEELGNARQDLGRIFTDLRKNPADAVSGGLSNLGRQIGSLGGLIGGSRSDTRSSAAEFAARRRAEEAQKVDAALKDLIANIDNHTRKVEISDPVVLHSATGHTLRRRSELTIQLEHASAAPSNEPGGAELALMVRASGYRSEINSREPAANVLDSGSDLRGATVTFRNLTGKDAQPKARINIPQLANHSSLPAVSRARDEVQRLIEQRVPGVEIEGVHRMEEKQVAVRNLGPEPVTVWFQVEHRSVRDHEFHWDWRPGAEERAYRMALPARSYKYLVIAGGEGRGDEIARGRRLRIWAESESGERWQDHRDDGIWLVEPNPQIGNERAYHGEKVGDFTYDLNPTSGPRIFSERLVELRNATPDSLEVLLRYRTSAGGRVVWRTLPGQALAPGQSLWPRDEDGFRARASRIVIQADGERRRYGDPDQPESLWLVEAADGRRQYRSEKIGTYLYVFQPNPGAAAAGASRGAAAAR